MVGPGVNLAITKDGGAYNKLQRPADYLALTTNAPQKDAPTIGGISPTSASKRKREDEDDTSIQKRTRASLDRTGRQTPRNGSGEKGKPRAAENGMRALLPGLDDDGGSSDEGSMSEALAYLRNVRSEALGIPDLLVAHPAQDDRDEDEHRVIYRDGTYIAVDEYSTDLASDQGSSETNSFPDPQERETELLLKRFHALRATLTDVADNQDLSKRDETLALARSLRKKRDWPDLINKESPKLSLAVQLNDAAVYHGLESCAENVEEATSISAHVSCWIWTLLALVGDVGTLNNDRIDCIRNLGRKAGVLATRLRKSGVKAAVLVEGDKTLDGSPQAPPEEEDLEEGEERELGEVEDGQDARSGHKLGEGKDNADILETVPTGNSLNDATSDAEMSISEDEDAPQHEELLSELERARARLLSQLGDRLVQPQVPSKDVAGTEKRAGQAQRRHVEGRPKLPREESDDLADYGVDLNTRSTLDMIWTIMAEHFGQRDLLEFRKRW